MGGTWSIYFFRDIKIKLKNIKTETLNYEKQLGEIAHDMEEEYVRILLKDSRQNADPI